ncbi:TPA: hypothetical protein I7551_07970 [Vibrio cholerae]|nr:hypothetical protein [Vibrio cholerae]
MKSQLRVLESGIYDVDTGQSNSPSAHDIVAFLSSIYHANQFKIEFMDRSSVLLAFDVPSFEILLLDEFSKRRIDRRLHDYNVLVLKLPKELSLLTKIDVSASIYENQMKIRFHISGKFITIRFEINTSDAFHMKKLLSDIHSSYCSTALCLVSSFNIYANDHDLIKNQISLNRVYNVITCSNENDSLDLLKKFDSDLMLERGLTCY